jgi:predicted dehydrogenase
MLRAPDSSLLKILPHDLCPEIANWNGYAELLDLRVAIVGFGKMGLLHSGILNLLVPRAVKAIVDKSLLLTFGASRIIKTMKFYRDIDKMLRETEPDAVYVTTPTSSHYSIVKNLLNKDVRYVFVEKPPTLNYEQAYHLSIKKDQRVMVGFQKRYALTFRHAKLLIDNGVIGEILHVNSYIRSGDILEPTNRFDALGRGALLDLGVHLVDLLTWFFKVKRIIKAESKSVYTRVDDVFRAELEAEGNVRISLEASWSNPEYRTPETYIEIQGTLGTMKVTEDYLKVNTKLEHFLLGNKGEVVLYKPNYYQGILPVNLADPEYTIENMHFLRCIRGNEEPLTSIESSLDTMKLIDALYEKAESYNG